MLHANAGVVVAMLPYKGVCKAYKGALQRGVQSLQRGAQSLQGGPKRGCAKPTRGTCKGMCKAYKGVCKTYKGALQGGVHSLPCAQASEGAAMGVPDGRQLQRQAQLQPARTESQLAGGPGIPAAVLLHVETPPLLLVMTQHLQQALVCDLIASRVYSTPVFLAGGFSQCTLHLKPQTYVAWLQR